MQRLIVKLSKFFVLSVLIMAFSVGVFPVNSWAAVQQMEFKDLKVNVWPEYDDPRVLVVLEGTMVNTSSSPYSGLVKWNIPKTDNLEIGMACEVVNGNHNCQPYNEKDNGQWTELSWKTTHPIQPGEEYPVYLEYYYNPLNGQLDKNFDFAYQPSYKIQGLSLSVQQPLKATNFQINPQPSNTDVDGSGFTNYNYLFSNQQPSDTVAVKVSYSKSDSNPSVKKGANQGAATSQTGNQIQLTSSLKNAKVWLPVLALIIVLVVFLIFAMKQNGKKQQIHARNKTHKANKADKKSTSSDPRLIKEKRKLRAQLLNGTISEETYHELVADLEDEYSR